MFKIFTGTKMLIKSEGPILPLFLAIKHNDGKSFLNNVKDSATVTQGTGRYFILILNVVHRIPFDFILRNTFYKWH